MIRSRVEVCYHNVQNHNFYSKRDVTATKRKRKRKTTTTITYHCT